MKRTSFWNLLFMILFLLLLAGQVLMIAAVIRLDMLPVGYVAALGGVFVALSVLVGWLLLGKKQGKGKRIAACVLALLLICGCAVITTVATDIAKTLEITRSDLFQIPTREIYVLEESTAQELSDLAGLTCGYLKGYDEECTRQVLEELHLQTENSLVTAGYTNTFTMVRALLNGKIDAMILNGGLVSVLEDAEEFADFSHRTRILSQVRVEETQSEETLPEIAATEETQENTEAETVPVPTQSVTQTVDHSALDPFAVYVSGSDSYDTDIVKNSRSDVNILAVVNPRTKQVLLLNTPRDYYVGNTGGGGKLDKLTHCGIYGIQCSMETLENLYNTEIGYFVRINFTGFKKLIDAMGGITVYSDYAFTAITRTPIAQGENHLTGQQALDFARERVTLRGGDNERGKHQMQVITAVIEKATSGTTVITNYSAIMESVEGMFQMNIPADLIGNLMKMQLSDMARWNIVSFAVTGTNAMQECYSVPGMELAVIEPSQASVDKARRLIEMVFGGEILTEAVVNSITG